MFPIRDTIPSRRRPIMTWSIIGANALVFAYQAMLPRAAAESFVYHFGLVPAALLHPDWAVSVGLPAGHWWQLATSMFLHGGFLHVITNLWFLWIFGDNVEDRMGPARFVVFYLTCGLAAAVLHGLANADSVAPTVGASGAIAGVLGAYLLLYPRARVVTVVPIFFYPLIFELPALLYLGFWFALQLLSGVASLGGPASAGGVAWWAHVGGFATGLLLVRFFAQRPPSRPRGHPDIIDLPSSYYRRR